MNKINDLKKILGSILELTKEFANTLKEAFETKAKDFKARKKEKDEKFDISIDDVKKEHEKVPKKIAYMSLGAAFFIIVILTVVTVLQQISEVDKERKVVDINKTSEGEIKIDIDEQSWKHEQTRKIKNVQASTKNMLKKQNQEFKQEAKKLRENINSDINSSMTEFKDIVKDIVIKMDGIKQDVKQELNANNRKQDIKFKNYIKKNKKSAQSRSISNPVLNTDTKLLPPALLNLSSTSQTNNSGIPRSVPIPPKEELIYIEPGSDEYDYLDVETDSMDIDIDDVATTLYTDNNASDDKAETAKYHIMKGIVHATLLTGVSAPTYGGGGNSNPAPVLFSIDGDTLVANNEYETIEDCLVSGSAVGNINTGKADVLLSEISCSGYNKDGERVKIENSLKGWVIGEDGSFGLAGRLLDSSGKVITKMIGLEIIKSLTQAMTLKALPEGSTTGLTGGLMSSPMPYSSAAQSGLGTGVQKGVDHIFDHYDQILTGMYPVISVRAGKKITILLKGGEDVKPSLYRNIDIYEDMEVE